MKFFDPVKILSIDLDGTKLEKLSIHTDQFGSELIDRISLSRCKNLVHNS